MLGVDDVRVVDHRQVDIPNVVDEVDRLEDRWQRSLVIPETEDLTETVGVGVDDTAISQGTVFEASRGP